VPRRGKALAAEHHRPSRAFRAQRGEHRTGSLEVGKDADIAVWEQNMYRIPPQELRNLKCSMTLVQGRVAYDAARPDR